MKYALAAAALFVTALAGGPPAYSEWTAPPPGTSEPVVYVTVTVTSCGGQYANCPAAPETTAPAYESSVVSVPVYPTSAPVESIPVYSSVPVESAPVYSSVVVESSWAAVPTYPATTAPAYPAPSGWATSAAAPYPSGAPAPPAYSGAWGSGTAVVAPSGTGAVYPSASWAPPATGAGEKIKAAGLLVGAGAAAALFL